MEDIVIGDGVQQYKSLREVEKRLDAAMVRKRLDIQDSVNRTVKRYRTLRIWISNTVENQPWQQAPDQNGAPNTTLRGGRYRVKIEGRLLDDNSDPTVPDESDSEDDRNDVDQQHDPDAMDEDNLQGVKPKKPTPTLQRERLSHFFKSITVDFDRPTSPGSADLATVSWNKPAVPANAASLPPSADFDSLEFSRSAEVNLNITISLVRDENPERFRVSKELAAILDVEEEARSGIVVGIWDYIKAMDLQENEEKRAVRCDSRLKSVWEGNCSN